ncbi:alpha/beta fold hydrolase [Streptomyces sp. NPDC051567]|uniref:alpha/beta fold hydrolase n=1 Tax=Streptomyces sp. NPDC051567 TaxID=3365660 RepID=UPI003795B39A
MDEPCPDPTGILFLDGRPIEYALRGSGTATTVFAHGLGDTMTQLAGLASQVAGRQAFFNFGGHGRSQAAPGPLRYDTLVGELLAVRAHTAGDRAVGLSMGAGAVLRLLVDHPGLLRRAVILLPATLDRRGADTPCLWFADLAEHVEKGQVDKAAAMLIRVCPPMPQSAAGSWSTKRAAFLIEHGYANRLREVGAMYPVRNTKDLARVTTPVMIMCHENDLAHSVDVGEQMAGLLPAAELHVLPDRSLLTSGREAAAQLPADFLNDA